MMGNNKEESPSRVPVPPSKPFLTSLKSNLKETFFPDDPFRQFKKQPLSKRIILGLQYFIPILEWAPHYSFDFFKSDLISGITIASLAVPQGISYANLANLPPIIGLYSSFVPPFIYAMLGSSRDLAVGTAAVASLLISAMIGKVVNPIQNPQDYLHLVFTATFVSGVMQASLGFLRLGFIVDLLSHATIVGFMGGAATIVCLQQLKGILGLTHFTHETDLISVMRSIFCQTHMWKWETALLGGSFLFFMLLTRFYSKRRAAFFWINAMAPLTSVILGSLLVYFTMLRNTVFQWVESTISEPDGFQITVSDNGYQDGDHHRNYCLVAEGVAVGRSFAMFKNYHIDGNKEMIAFGIMNIAGSFTSCYLTSGPFSKTAVNFNAGCKTAVSNIVMAVAVMITLLFLTPLFHYTPLVVLASIIIAAMLGLIDYEAAIHLWKVDKFDFLICINAYVGVVFGSIEIGLILAVATSLLRLLLSIARPKTTVLGNIPNTMTYRNTEQYRFAQQVPGILILQIHAPIYFASANYLRERILRWTYEEENRTKSSAETSLQYVILDMSAVGSIDTSGISMLDEVKRNTDTRGLKLVLANPGSEVMKKLCKSNFIEIIGHDWIHPTIARAVGACSFALPTSKNNSVGDGANTQDINIWPQDESENPD
ncbi:Sulfate transporter 3.1 [Ancistrocladus abbreviatus]